MPRRSFVSDVRNAVSAGAGVVLAAGVSFCFPSIMHAEPPVIIAHRGASHAAPENTLSSIRAALDEKTDWIEFDVRATADGTLVLQHDKTLERFLGDKRPFDTLTDRDIEIADVGAWFHEKFAGETMPTMEDAIAACLPHATPLIEHKTGTPEAYLEVIRKLQAEDKVIVQSFDWEFIGKLRDLEPRIRIGALGSKELKSDRRALLEELKPDLVGWNHEFLIESDVSWLQDLGAKVAVWTVNDLARIRAFTLMGVDALITDRPAGAREASAQAVEAAER